MHDGDGMGSQGGWAEPLPLGEAPISVPQAKKIFGRNAIFIDFWPPNVLAFLAVAILPNSRTTDQLAPSFLHQFFETK